MLSRHTRVTRTLPPLAGSCPFPRSAVSYCGGKTRESGQGCSNTKEAAAQFGAGSDRPGGISILMFSFRSSVLCSVLLPILCASASLGQQAPEPQPQPSTTAPQEPSKPATAPAQSAGALSVQARIKARREQRRAAAIHDVYSHLYEAYVGAGYERFFPGPALQRVNEYSWNVGVTRYYGQRFGVTIDGRGTYGSPFLGLNPNNPSNDAITKPAVSQYTAMIGPTYRIVLEPRYSISARVMGGYERGNFSGDTNGFAPASLGLWPDSSTFAISVSVPFEYNVSPGIGLRLAPEYFATGFGSSIQNNRGFTGGLVFRWGKQ